MNLLFIAALSLAQAPKSQAFSVDLPPGVSREFSSLVYNITELGAKGDYVGAERLLDLLPKRQIVLGWDDSKVPKDQKSVYQAGRDEAIEMIQTRVPGVKIRVEKRSKQLQFSFEPLLATPPNSVLPAGATSFWSENSSAPRIETVIGLQRGKPLIEASESDVFAEVAYGIGSYLGLGHPSYYNGFMTRSDQPWSVKLLLPGQEVFTVQSVLSISDKLTQAVQQKKPIENVRPQLVLNPKEIDGGEVFQGEPVPLTFQVSNLGSGPLSFLQRATVRALLCRGATWWNPAALSCSQAKSTHARCRAILARTCT